MSFFVETPFSFYCHHLCYDLSILAFFGVDGFTASVGMLLKGDLHRNFNVLLENEIVREIGNSITSCLK